MARRAPARQNRLNSPSYDQLTRTRQSLGHRRPCCQIRPSTASLRPAQAPAIFHAVRRTPSAQYFRKCAKMQSTLVSTPRPPQAFVSESHHARILSRIFGDGGNHWLKSMQRTWGTCGSCLRVDPNRARVRRSRPLGSSFLLPASVLTVKNTRGNFAFSSIGTMPTMRWQDRPRCLVGRSGRLRQARKRVRDPWPRRELPSPAFPGR